MAAVRRATASRGDVSVPGKPTTADTALLVVLATRYATVSVIRMTVACVVHHVRALVSLSLLLSFPLPLRALVAMDVGVGGLWASRR